MLVFSLDPIQLAATLKLLLKNDYTFQNVYGDAYEFQVYTSGEVKLRKWFYDPKG